MAASARAGTENRWKGRCNGRWKVLSHSCSNLFAGCELRTPPGGFFYPGLPDPGVGHNQAPRFVVIKDRRSISHDAAQPGTVGMAPPSRRHIASTAFSLLFCAAATTAH